MHIKMLLQMYYYFVAFAFVSVIGILRTRHALEIGAKVCAEGGISFKATSNDVTATPKKDGIPLRRAMLNNKTFREDKDKLSIIQSSESHCDVQAAHYGLVSAIMDAYNHHHNLILRPDDVWQAILTQFSFYVNAHAEELRDRFVDFDGKRKLIIEMPGTLFSADFGEFANRMVDEEIIKNIKNPAIAEWLIPAFSTTKSEDRIVASVTIMSTLQAYFEYEAHMTCGIPEVHLEGTVEDWRLLRRKVDSLPDYDIKGKDPVMAKWRSLLVKVLDELVKSAEGNASLHFWDTVCSEKDGGSGPSYLSGWVTVFACFTADGRWQGGVPQTALWPFIETTDIPGGVVSVPVLVNDNGVEYNTHMFAGQFAYEMSGEHLDTVRPRNDWNIAYDGKKKA
mmetsp:Transcript_35787/g.52456  ORF Transcript_35787/g.52456 Transcript_35787/m.52456 type:complete len:394 (+) Transcript_35787:244-1425(+)